MIKKHIEWLRNSTAIILSADVYRGEPKREVAYGGVPYIEEKTARRK